MINDFFCLESIQDSKDYRKIWDLSKSGYNPEDWFLNQSSSSSLSEALYSLIGLKIIGSYSFNEVKNSIMKKDYFINSIPNNEDKIDIISKIIKGIERKTFKEPS